MTTILGHHIRLIRPERPKKPIILQGDYPKAKYDKKPKTRELGMCEFFKACMDFEDKVPRPKYWRK